MPAAATHLVGRSVEDVEDVRRLAVADLDPEGIDEDQLLQAVAAGGGNFGREPAAEGKPDEGRLVAWQRLEHGEMEMDEVVDGVEIRRPRRLAKAGGGGCRDLGMPAEEVEKRRPRVDRVEAVQHQDRMPGAAPQHLELDPGYLQPPEVRHRIFFPAEFLGSDL